MAASAPDEPGTTGLSQDMAAVSLAGTEQLQAARTLTAPGASQLPAGMDELPALGIPLPPGLPSPASLSPDVTAHLEQILLLALENIRAQMAIAPEGGVADLSPARLFGSRDGLWRGLHAMGFRPGASLPWERLGVCWDEGPLPGVNVVEARVRVGQQLLLLMEAPVTDAAAQEEYRVAAHNLDQDGATCLELLPELRKARVKRAPAQVIRYRELEYPFLRYLHESLFPEAGDLIATQGSDLQGCLTQAAMRVLEPPQVRQLHQHTTKDAAGGAPSLEDTLADRWVMWAPDERSQLGRMAASLRKLRSAAPDAKLALLTARPVLPGRPSPAAMAEFWSSALFQGEVGKMVEQVMLLEPPIRTLPRALMVIGCRRRRWLSPRSVAGPTPSRRPRCTGGPRLPIRWRLPTQLCSTSRRHRLRRCVSC